MKKADKVKIRHFLIDYAQYLDQRVYDLQEANEDVRDIQQDLQEIQALIQRIQKEI